MNYIKIPLDGQPAMNSMTYIYAGYEISANGCIYIEEIEICNCKIDINDIHEYIINGVRSCIYDTINKVIL